MGRFLVPAAALVLASCAISTQREVEIGENYSTQLNRQLPIVRDPEVQRYVTLLGDSIARLSDDRSLDWRFFVVDSREVNAFAVPGGFVYVNRGLIERTTNMSQLAGVLAHEIGHVIHRHSVKQMQAQQRAGAGLTVVCILTSICEYGVTDVAVQVGGGALFARFSREDEEESDLSGIDYLVRARIDPRGIPEMFRILIRERDNSPQGLGGGGWFRTHPLEEARVERTEAAIRALGPAAIPALTRDTPRYQAFRARVSTLPAPAERRTGVLVR